MKQELIEQGHALLKRIEDCNDAVTHLDAITQITIKDGNLLCKGEIRMVGPSYLDKSTVQRIPISPESQEFMQSEFIRFMGRLKRHFTELERKYKEEFEDL